jgi:hypothetical protein
MMRGGEVRNLEMIDGMKAMRRVRMKKCE